MARFKRRRGFRGRKRFAKSRRGRKRLSRRYTMARGGIRM